MSRSAVIGILAGLMVAALILICTSCDQRQYVQAQPPTVVTQAAPAPAVVVQSNHDGFVSGMLLGHMMSSPTVIHHYPAPAYVAPRSTTIVRNTTIINRSVSVSPSRSFSASRSSSFGSFRRR